MPCKVNNAVYNSQILLRRKDICRLPKCILFISEIINAIHFGRKILEVMCKMEDLGVGRMIILK